MKRDSLSQNRPESGRTDPRDGFKDGSGYYLTDRKWSGVWLSNVPLDGNEGARGDVLLAVSLRIKSAELRAKYEWIEEGKGYREFLIPAAVVNSNVTRMMVVNCETYRMLS